MLLARRLTSLVVLLTCTFVRTLPAQEANYDEAKVPDYTLPDPLVLASGETVTDAKSWQNRRRPEILELFEKHVYGTMPGQPAVMRVTKDVREHVSEVTLHFSDKDSGPQARLLVLLPTGYGHKPPYPAFLAYNFRGNHTISSDETITKSLVWRGGKAEVPGDETRGASASRWPVEQILKRGYALATIYYGDVDPDFHDGFKNGVHALYPELQKRGDNWSSIGAWAWGLSRAMDYFESDDLIDQQRVAVMGHSRLGKTSLWTGAHDERFALVISNNSGCGGAALSRREFGETVRRINSSFPHWFCGNFKQFNNNLTSLPVDQHMLISLIAPRPVYIASAEQDRWADPRGEFLSALHADPVYRLLVSHGLGTDKMPEVNQPASTGTVGYHIRTGKHDVTGFDWQQYLDFADRHFGKSP